MAASKPTDTKSQVQSEDEFKQGEIALQKDQLWFGYPLHFYQGFWCLNMISDITISFQTNFQAQDTDVILASLPKTGTTWLKSLLFSIVNRKKYSDVSQHPLHSITPHELIDHLEFEVYKNCHGNDLPDLTKIPLPRLFATHMPYLPLPESIKTSKCRIIYVCRNPLDNFVSSCHFWPKLDLNKGMKLDVNIMEEHLDKYCKGIFPFGPYEDHLLGYWKESMKNSNKVLFLEYEGLKKEPKDHLKRLAEFVGCPFSKEEEKGNVIDEIIELCSIKSLKEMEINKRGKYYEWFENKALFRKGEVGDWSNYLTPSMAKRIEEMQERLKEAGFSFTYYNHLKAKDSSFG
ncbi:cytosolic sulfotransferase 5-like [Chenopodium quinoa]|uniref:Sulfotransferase n=1 Tax=Chenopodium quinoa TaxID=63459 RepID=A0A803MMT8_CHEQI|nr:cytosolic sulfotransferase 5-like [Chenopodium quinoa]